MPLTEHILLGSAILLLVSIISSKATGRLGVPALLVFLAIGMLAGSEGLGGIYFDNAYIAQTIGIVALAFILFAGGISTEWKSIRPVAGKGIALSTAGVFLTAFVMGAAAHTLAGFTWIEGLILGSIVSSTDAAAVFSVLRSRNVSLKGNLRPLLELESGSNDPMAVFLTIGFISLLSQPENSFLNLFFMFAQQMILGGALGYALARLFVLFMNRLRLEYEGLYTVLGITFVLLTYGLTTTLGGNGFLAVYLLGLLLGKSDFIHKNSVIRYHDGIAWLMQIGMFLVLGLLVFPSRLVPVASTGLFLSVILMFLARPISVFATLSFFPSVSLRERILISWVGLRGAAPIILATFPLIAGLEKAETMFNLVFFIVLSSVLLQGTLIPWVARKLGLDSPLDHEKKPKLELTSIESTTAQLHELQIEESSLASEKQIVELGFPKNALIVLITRGDHYVVPRGNTLLKTGDRILILADHEEFERVQYAFRAGSAPPIPN